MLKRDGHKKEVAIVLAEMPEDMRTAKLGKHMEGYYDLLASESRIASLVTIAKNEVSPSHWLHLGRPLTQMAGTRALLSWGGTMFEYLMPV